MTDDERFARTLLGRTAMTMVAEPAPMARLAARRRRSRVRRFIGAASVVVLLLGGGTLAQTAAPNLPIPGLNQLLDRGMPGQEVRSEWAWRLIESPTRGNLAADRRLVDAVTAAFDEHSRGDDGSDLGANISRSLDHVRLLFLHQAGARRHAVAVFYNDTHAAVMSVVGAADADAEQLVRHPSDSSAGGSVEPFLVLDRTATVDSVVALAPAGCDIAVSAAVDVDAQGRARRQWTGLGDWTTRPMGDSQDWWQVTCDGEIHYRQPMSRYPEVRPDPDAPTTALRGTADPGAAARASGAWRISGHGLPVAGTVVWGGVPPGRTEPVVVLTAPAPGGGVAVLALTGDGSFPTFADGPDSRRVQGPPDEEIDVAVTTGAATAALIVVRLPDPSGAVGDRLLVIGPPDAQHLRTTASPDLAPVTGGVAVVTAPRPMRGRVEAVRDGVVVASIPVEEPTAGPARFGVELIDNW